MQTTPHFNVTHGHAGRGKTTQTYKTWCSMHRRCYMPSQSSWTNYGGRGIKVCAAWHEFEAFLEDMGEQPPNMTIERKNPMEDYSPENCVWATTLQQARNRTNTCWLTFQGETLCLTEWAERLGIKPKTLRARIDDHGWSVERALSAPVMTLSQAAKHARQVRWVNSRKKS